MDGRCSSPGEMMESSGRVTPFCRPPMSAAVDSNTAMPSSSLDRTPHGDARDNAIITCWVTELRFWDHRAVEGKWNVHRQVYQVYLVSWCKGSTFIYTHTAICQKGTLHKLRAKSKVCRSAKDKTCVYSRGLLSQFVFRAEKWFKCPTSSVA
jgi:hypothetical protein